MNGDDIGDRDRWRFALLMTQIAPGRTNAVFRPRFLGDKFPTFDYLVELVGSESHFFFAQVKTTNRGYRGGSGTRCLRGNVDRVDVDRMVASPIPAYVVGIDEPGRLGYVFSMNEARRTGLGGLPTRHPIDCPNLQLLWLEVRNFWTTRDMTWRGSHFV